MQGVDGLAFDSLTGELFASSRTVNSGSGRAGFYELSLQSGSFLHPTLITSSAFPTTFSPDGIETDGQGNVYLACQGPSSDSRIYRYDMSTGQLTALTSPLAGLDDLVPLSGVGGHSAPDYWFFEQTAGQFGKIDPTTGRITEIPLPNNSRPQVDGITAGPNGTVWFTESSTNRIGMIDTDTGVITEFPLSTPGAQPFGIVEGPDGSIWFTESGANQVGRINPTTHAIQEFVIDSSGNDQAEGIAVGSDANLWFILAGTDKIGVMNPKNGAMVGEYGVPTANAGLSQIVSNPADGNLWFTEASANKVGRINPTSKAFTELAVPTANAAPGAIAVQKSGKIWFIESNASRVGVLSPNNLGSIAEYVVSGLTPTPTPTPTPSPNPTPTPTPSPAGPIGGAARTRIVLKARPRAATLGRPVTLTATVKVLGRRAGKPVGFITFLDGTVSLGTVALRHGKASLRTSSLQLGPNTIHADYTASPTFAPGRDHHRECSAHSNEEQGRVSDRAWDACGPLHVRGHPACRNRGDSRRGGVCRRRTDRARTARSRPEKGLKQGRVLFGNLALSSRPGGPM